MKKIYLFLGFVLLTSAVKAQVSASAGLKINPGIGFIRSGTLNSVFGSEKNADSLVINSSARTGAGMNIGVGGFYQFNINPVLSVLAEPTINLLYSRIYINYKKEDLDINSSGMETRISSIAKLRMFYFNVPVLAKYLFLPNKRLYAIGGFSVNINTKPHLKYEESNIVSEYSYGSIFKTNVTNASSNATLDHFNATQFNFIIGAGKNFRRALKNLSVDIRYNLPLTSSSMYTSKDIAGEASNNSIFSDKETFQVARSGNDLKRPNNFKMGLINVTIRYTFYKK
jgi:hypothetical protein